MGIAVGVGRKRKPAALHVLNGTYKPGRHGPKDAQQLLPPAELEPPEWLQGVALAEWERITALLRPAQVLTEGDRGILLMSCLLYSDIVEMASKQLPVPETKVAQYRLCCSELGLTPAARTKLSVSRGKKENPFGAFGAGSEPERPGPPVRRAG